MATTPSFRPYLKQPLTALDVLVKLKTQGLVIADDEQASRFLDRVCYFRFRGYLYPYLDIRNAPTSPSFKNFKPGATFEKALQMYFFDEGLRRLIFNLLPEVEVALRASIDAAICQVAGHGFWHLQPEWFKKDKHPTRIINSLSAAFCDSSEAYARHYRGTYYNEKSGAYKHLPPFWVLAELSTLGQIKEIYENLSESSSSFPQTTLPKNTVLDKMAQKRFGADNYRDLTKWVHLLRDIRNICAHHGRLWNKNVIAAPGIASKVSKPFPILHPESMAPKLNTAYAGLVVIRIMSKKLGINDGIKSDLLNLFAKYPEANQPDHLHSMGIPLGWNEDTLWD